MTQICPTSTSSPVMFSKKNKQLITQNEKLDPEISCIVKKGLNIANYYIPYHLRSNCKHESLRGLPKTFLVPPSQPSELYLAIGKLASSMEHKNSTFFDGLPNHLKLKNDTAKQSFMRICKQIYSGGINWGRVVTVLVLGGAFAVHFVNKGQLEIVKNIPIWIKEVIEIELSDWIKNQGGWVRFY